MKLSALLLSINIVAAMPQLAQAGEQAVSDKADWLKRNLKSIERVGKASTCKLSLSQFSPTKKASKLRSFVPNRPLLRQKDLDTYLVAQHARIDSSIPTKAIWAPYTVEAQQDPILSGLVSAYSLSNEPSSTQTAFPSGLSYGEQAKKRFPTKSLPRAIPSPPALPAQRSTLPGLYPSLPTIPEPPPVAMPPLTLMKPAASVARQQTSGEHLIKQSGALLVQAPALNPDEQSLLDELVELNRPGRCAQFQDIVVSPAAPVLPSMMDSAPRHDPGPPPFPLSLLPEDAINDFICRGHGRRIDAPRAYFGSWHQAAVPLSSLPKAGFKSYAGSRKASGGSFTQHAHVAYHMNSRQRQENRAKKFSLSAASAVEPTSAPIYQAKVLVYPPYDSHCRISMF